MEENKGNAKNKQGLREFLRLQAIELRELLLPAKCSLCRTILQENERGICQRCWEEKEPIHRDVCRKCGRKLERDQSYCYDCSRNRHEYVQGYCMFDYEEVKEAVLAMKYRHERWRAVGLGKLMAWLYRESAEEWQIEAVAFVPQSWLGIGEKGYNPPQVIAQILAKEWNLPLLKGQLLAHRKHHKQKKLGSEARKNNLKNVFYCKGDIMFRRILLVDDVYTTGATIDACSLLLKESGAAEVYFLTIAGGGFKS